MGQIRDLIRERGLKVGDVLPSEVGIAEMFGASRNTAREAIRVLRTYGIVESRQKVGAVITDRRNAAMMDAFSFAIEISAEAFQDIQGFRRLIEVNLADALVTNIDEPTIADLETINAAMLASTNPGEASNLDFRFHRLLVAVAGNRTLREMYDMLEPIIRNLMENGKSIPRRLESANRDHQDLVAALRARDRIAFAYHMNRHLDDGLHIVAGEGDRQG